MTGSRCDAALNTTGGHLNDSASVEEVAKTLFFWILLKYSNECRGHLLVHQLSTSVSGLGLLFQCFASWMYKDESCSSYPAVVVILRILQTPGTKDINLLSSKCLKNDKMLFR